MSSKYNNSQIAKELQATASGASYYGSALLAARDMPFLTNLERQCVLRYLEGSQLSTDHCLLQDAAIKIAGQDKTGAQLLRERFEKDINAEARLYNLMPSDKPGQTYWSLHTERAWGVYKAGVRYGAELAIDITTAGSKEPSNG